ncbi:MAG: DUF1302 domain-containing protein [Gammaproteobacteria bacterium]
MSEQKRTGAGSTLMVLALSALAGPAFGLEYYNGDFRLQMDSTLSVGASWRADDVDYRGVGLANALAAQAAGDNPSGAHHYHGSSAADDSNLLWKQGSTFSELAKLVVDLEMTYRDYGAFIRGKAVYDHRIVNGDGVTDLPTYYWQDANGNNRLPNQSAGSSAEILDAFVWANWWVGEKPLNVRLGKQVISWGEGLLFANGINSINPVDVNALLAPGSEVKDALLPLNALSASFGISDALTLEGFVLLDWRETELPECGTFFSITDLVGAGCYAGFVPSGLESSHPDAAAVTLPRGSDVEPDKDGQFGVAARYFAESIETEFSLYYTSLHSNLPVISGHTPYIEGTPLADLINFINAQGVPGRDYDTGSLVDIRRFLMTDPDSPALALGPLAGTARLQFGDYFVESPEDIQLIGASFSTTLDIGLPGGGTAISGEISMRKDQPFAREDGDALSGAVGLPSLACADAPVAYDCYSQYAPGEYNQGYITTDYYQAELVFIHFFDNILGASRWSAVLDIAGSYLDLPGKSTTLLNSSYNATLNHPWLPNVVTVPGIPAFPFNLPYPIFIQNVAWETLNSFTAAPEDDYFPTSGAWGYKLRFSGEYNNVFAGINLRPTLSFSHDVYGTTPSPIANFLEDRKALGLAVEAVYLNDYSVNIAYTDFFGAEPYNQLADRDYYSVSAQVSF